MRDAERGRVAQVDGVGHDRHRTGRHDDPLRVRADEARAVDPVADRDSGDAVTHRAHDARELTPRDERGGELDLVLVGDDEYVRKVDRRVRDVDEDFTGSGNRIGDLLHHDRLRRTVLEHTGGAHRYFP